MASNCYLYIITSAYLFVIGQNIPMLLNHYVYNAGPMMSRKWGKRFSRGSSLFSAVYRLHAVMVASHLNTVTGEYHLQLTMAVAMEDFQFKSANHNYTTSNSSADTDTNTGTSHSAHDPLEDTPPATLPTHRIDLSRRWQLFQMSDVSVYK